MNIARIPKTYQKRLGRLTVEQQAFILMSLMSLVNNEDVSLPDNTCGDILEDIWADCLRMEKKNTKASDIEAGVLVGSMPDAIVYNNIVQDSITSTTSQKINSDLNQVKTSKPRIKKFIPPTLEEVVEWCKTSGHNLDGDKIFHYYNDADWKDSRGKQVKNWKQKIRGVWCRDENKIVESKDMSDEDKIRDFRNLSPSQFRKKHGLQEQIRIGDIVGE